eukprot:SAG11_NODE_1539_length_4722_cov_4.377028_8_plen_181_part_00
MMGPEAVGNYISSSKVDQPFLTKKDSPTHEGMWSNAAMNALDRRIHYQWGPTSDEWYSVPKPYPDEVKRISANGLSYEQVRLPPPPSPPPVRHLCAPCAPPAAALAALADAEHPTAVTFGARAAAGAVGWERPAAADRRLVPGAELDQELAVRDPPQPQGQDPGPPTPPSTPLRSPAARG